MKKINWTPDDSKNHAWAQIGGVVMQVNRYFPIVTKTKRWRADASIRQECGTFRTGPIRKTMDKAKEDAVRLARELLLDHHTCLLAEMKNFDIEVQDKGGM